MLANIPAFLKFWGFIGGELKLGPHVGETHYCERLWSHPLGVLWILSAQLEFGRCLVKVSGFPVVTCSAIMARSMVVNRSSKAVVPDLKLGACDERRPKCSRLRSESRE